MVISCTNIDKALTTKTDLKGNVARSLSSSLPTRTYPKPTNSKSAPALFMTLCDKVTKKNELSVPVMVEHEDKKEGECVLSMDGLGDKIWTDKRSNLGITVLHCGALLSFLFDSIPMETCGELGHAQRHKRVGCASLLLAVASGFAFAFHCVLINIMDYKSLRVVDAFLISVGLLLVICFANCYADKPVTVNSVVDVNDGSTHTCSHNATTGCIATPTKTFCHSSTHWLHSFSNMLRVRVLLAVTVLGMSFQSAAAAPITVDLTTFTSGAGARYIGTANSITARDLAVIGDHNGDGFADYMLSSFELSLAVIVMKKNTTNTEVSLASIVSGEYFRVIKGPLNVGTGSAIGGVGDINADGFDDALLGSNYCVVTGRSSNPGCALVLFGMKGPFTDVVFTSDWPASSLGFMIFGPVGGANFLGQPRIACGLGDVNGDGVDDFAVSAYSHKRLGVTWVIFGKKTLAFTTIDLLPTDFSSHGVYYSGQGTDDQLGFAVGRAGDFNGDGIADFLIGAPNHDPLVGGESRNSGGATYLIHGSKTALATMDMSTFVTGAMGVRFIGAAASSLLGQALAGVGDVNGDGIDDIAIGAPLVGNGVVYVIYGTTIAFTMDVDLLNFAASSVGYAIDGRATGMQLSTVAPAGDIDGDGINDILVGGTSGNSRAHIVYGQRGVRTTNLNTFTENVFTFFYTSGAYLGNVAGGADFNGDGFPDILLGAPYATVTPEGGDTAIASSGAAWMLPGPFIFPTPTMSPTTAPTAPTALPTVVPTESPTMPTALPSIQPSAAPSPASTSAPSLQPSASPTATPSAVPSTNPTIIPSVFPSHAPSMSPSDSPTAVPSFSPTVEPTRSPAVDPTAPPTAIPSTPPTASPSEMPSASPTYQPTVNPSVSPSQNPTVVPSLMPTVGPSVTPTARPTVPAVKEYEVVVDVEQDVTFIDKDDYDAQKAACNSTIQHTVAAATDGVIPNRVTDIVVEEEEEEGRRLRASDRGVALSAAPGSVRLKYRITLFDPVLTVEKLRVQLVQAAQEGKMDRDLHYYAAQFGATSLVNGTFGEPQVTSAAVQRHASEQLTGVQIALVVIGIIVGLSLLGVIVMCVLHQQQAQLPPVPAEGALNMVL